MLKNIKNFFIFQPTKIKENQNNKYHVIQLLRHSICRSFTEFRDPKSINLNFIDIYIEVNNDILHGWFINNSNSLEKLILFLHGNAGNISTRLDHIKMLYDIGFSVLIFDYPGYGKSQGNPNEKKCFDSAVKFTEYAINELKFNVYNITIYGESLGCTISSYLSSKYKFRYVILQSGFYNLSELTKDLIVKQNNILRPIFNYCIPKIVKDFSTIKYMSNKETSYIIIHSIDDELIPFRHAQNLSVNNKLISIKGTHNKPIFNSLYFNELEKILNY